MAGAPDDPAPIETHIDQWADTHTPTPRTNAAISGEYGRVAATRALEALAEAARAELARIYATPLPDHRRGESLERDPITPAGLAAFDLDADDMRARYWGAS